LGHGVAISFGEDVKASRTLKILWITPELDSAAWHIFNTHGDKEFSYTDCTSFALMDKEAITSAFTFDKHFQQYGLHTTP
jgi:hypothetical protein